MSISVELHLASRSGGLCSLSAIPAAYGVMKIGQAARLVLFDHLKFEDCSNMDFARTAVVIGTSAGLLYYWPVVLEIPNKLKFVQERKNHPGYKLLEGLCRSVTSAAAVGTVILCAKIKNPRDQMLVCSGFMAVQALIYFVTPEPVKRRRTATDSTPPTPSAKPPAAVGKQPAV